MRVEWLADHVELIPVLTDWFRREWPEASVEHDPAARLEQFCSRDRIPLSVVAMDGPRPIGTASLLTESVSSHKHLSPWVAGLYVVPEARGRGVATRLIAALSDIAKSLDIGTIYIGIGSAQAHYERLGWRPMGIGRADGDEVIVLSKSL